MSVKIWEWEAYMDGHVYVGDVVRMPDGSLWGVDASPPQGGEIDLVWGDLASPRELRLISLDFMSRRHSWFPLLHLFRRGDPLPRVYSANLRTNTAELVHPTNPYEPGEKVSFDSWSFHSRFQLTTEWLEAVSGGDHSQAERLEHLLIQNTFELGFCTTRTFIQYGDAPNLEARIAMRQMASKLPSDERWLYYPIPQGGVVLEHSTGPSGWFAVYSLNSEETYVDYTLGGEPQNIRFVSSGEAVAELFAEKRCTLV